MSSEDVAALLARAITNCLKRSGRSAPRIDPYMRVIDGIAGFDSYCGLEVTLELEEQLGLELEDNIFVKEVDGRPRARTFNEVIGFLMSIIDGGANGR